MIPKPKTSPRITTRPIYVRVALHRRIKAEAGKAGRTLYSFAEELLERALNDRG